MSLDLSHQLFAEKLNMLVLDLNRQIDTEIFFLEIIGYPYHTFKLIYI